jgi:hypothetical protein
MKSWIKAGRIYTYVAGSIGAFHQVKHPHDFALRNTRKSVGDFDYTYRINFQKAKVG